MQGKTPTDLSFLSQLLLDAYKHTEQFALTVERASKALSPWPHLWTLIPTAQGEKRMKILETEISNSKANPNEQKLVLKTVQIEGKNSGKWEDVKNAILASANV